MVQLSIPDGIKKWQVTDGLSFQQMSSAMSDSMQIAFNKRERADWVWANSGERSAQTGMVQGSRGYQIDTETEYIWDNSIWNITRPHTEWTVASKSISSSTVTDVGTLTLDASASTSSTQATIAGQGAITVVNTGVYAFHGLVWTGGIFSGSRTFAEINQGGSNTICRNNSVNTETMVNICMPNMRITVTNTTVYLRFFQQSGGSLSVQGRIRLTRLG